MSRSLPRGMRPRLSSDKRKWTIPRRFVTSLFVSPPTPSHSGALLLRSSPDVGRSDPIMTFAHMASSSLPLRARLRCGSPQALLAASSTQRLCKLRKSLVFPLPAQSPFPMKFPTLLGGSLQHASAVGSLRRCGPIQSHPVAAIIRPIEGHLVRPTGPVACTPRVRPTAPSGHRVLAVAVPRRAVRAGLRLNPVGAPPWRRRRVRALRVVPALAGTDSRGSTFGELPVPDVRTSRAGHSPPSVPWTQYLVYAS